MKSRIFPVIGYLAVALFCLTITIADAASWREPYDNAVTLHRQGNDAQALESARLALAIAEKGKPWDEYRTVKCLNLLAALNKAKGDLSEAERLYARSNAVQSRILGATHPNTVASMVTLADSCAAQGKCDQAESLYRTVIGVCRERGRQNDPAEADALSALAAMCLTQGREKEAEGLLVGAVNMYELQAAHQPKRSAKMVDAVQRLRDVRKSLHAATGEPIALSSRGEVPGGVR